MDSNPAQGPAVVLPFDILNRYHDHAISIISSGLTQGDQLKKQLAAELYLKNEETKTANERMVGVKAQLELLASLKAKLEESMQQINKQASA